MIKNEYRADIDGLRGVAVLLVIIYHYFPRYLPSGFIGVDIFFVISGYVISLILFSSIMEGAFNLKEFYVRRICRIFPALCVILIFAIVVGWFILDNNYYEILGRHIVAGASFVLNILLFFESGYFAGASSYKPLIHLWSLGVEEQFYIIWPILLYYVWYRRINFLFVLLLVFWVSFLANLFLIRFNSIIAFYSPFSRFWELMVGGGLAYLKIRHPVLLSSRVSNLLTPTIINLFSVLGVGLIGICLLFLNNTKPFPSYWALLPCMGSFFIISAPDSWVNRKILSSRILVYVGLISYPLYLWHWLLLSLATISMYTFFVLLWKFKLGLFLISVFLAWLTYKFIEQPIRSNKHENGITAIFLCVGMSILCVCGYIIYKYQGFPERLGEKQNYLKYFNNNPPFYRYLMRQSNRGAFEGIYCSFYDVKNYMGMVTDKSLKTISKNCYMRGKNTNRAILIWGDSHSHVLYSGLRSTLPQNISILQITSPNCHPAVKTKNVKHYTQNYCQVSNQFALKTIERELPDVVILAQYKGHNVAEFRKITQAIKRYNRHIRVLEIGPAPSWLPELYKVIALRYWENTPDRISTNLDLSVFAEEQRIKRAIRADDEFEYVSLLDLFCNKDGCLTYLNGDKRDGITTFDSNHLTTAASLYVAQKILAPTILKNF